jgi:hypothetical protein
MPSTREILLALRSKLTNGAHIAGYVDGKPVRAVWLELVLECVDWQLGKLQEEEKLYPCDNCPTMRTKAEGGSTFTVCDPCWDKLHPAEPPAEEKPYDFAEVRRRAHQEYSEAPEAEAAEPRCFGWINLNDCPECAGEHLCNRKLPCPLHPKRAHFPHCDASRCETYGGVSKCACWCHFEERTPVCLSGWGRQPTCSEYCLCWCHEVGR